MTALVGEVVHRALVAQVTALAVVVLLHIRIGAHGQEP